jgi:hypothetical protein
MCQSEKDLTLVILQTSLKRERREMQSGGKQTKAEDFLMGRQAGSSFSSE